MKRLNLFSKESTSYSRFLNKKHSLPYNIKKYYTKINVPFHHFLSDAQHGASSIFKGKLTCVLFSCIGGLFTILSLLIYLKTTNYTCHSYLGNCYLLKLTVNMMSCLFAGAAFFTGHFFHPETTTIKNTANRWIEKGKRIANILYKHICKIRSLSSNSFHSFPTKFDRS